MKYLVNVSSANPASFNSVTGQDELCSFKTFQLKFKYHAQIDTTHLTFTHFIYLNKVKQLTIH